MQIESHRDAGIPGAFFGNIPPDRFALLPGHGFHGFNFAKQGFLAIEHPDLGVNPGGRQGLGSFDSSNSRLPKWLARSSRT